MLQRIRVVGDFTEVGAVVVFFHRPGKGSHLVGSDVAEPEGDLLGAGDLESLPRLDGGDKLGSLKHGLMGPGVEPGDAAAERDHVSSPLSRYSAVEIGDLQLAARRRLEPGGDVAHGVVVKIQAGYREVGTRFGRLLLDAEGGAVAGELDHAVALRVA